MYVHFQNYVIKAGANPQTFSHYFNLQIILDKTMNQTTAVTGKETKCLAVHAHNS